MIARLWWKEARQVWPIWVFLAGLGLVWLAGLRWSVEASPSRVPFLGPVSGIAFLYMFLVGAAAFAGERENRTLGFLDALPVERWRVWVAKASFAAATTVALLLLYWVFASLLLGPAQAAGLGGIAAIGFGVLWSLGWSFLWSALLGNALLAAPLAMASMAAALAPLNWLQSIHGAGAAAESLTVWHWIFAVALVAASAAILQFGGPPRTSWFGTQRRPLPDLTEIAEKNISHRRSDAVWPTSMWRLVWQALREAWPVWWPLMAMGLALLAAFAWIVWTKALIDPSVWFLGAILVSLVLGANVFNAENRGEPHRFLANHGARPGVVWLVKLAVGLVMAAPVWLVWLAPSYWGIGKLTGQAPEGWSSLQVNMVFIGSSLATAFASGALCGMVFRRGITAALVSLVVWLAVSMPLSVMVSSQVLWPTRLFWVPVAILAVTWAWSGDWLLGRPGFGRWARLGAYSAAAVVVLFSAHVAERVWSVPAIPRAERERIFQFDRIAAPVPPEQNAASLYREVAAARMGYPAIESMSLDEWGIPYDVWNLPYRDWDASDPKLLAWLSRNAKSLETLRKAAAMPVCRFQDLRTMTAISAVNQEPGLRFFDLALATSARVRFAQGDLKGSWEDIEALLRMARQFSGLNPEQVRHHGEQAERMGLSLAMRWANDPRLTAELLKTARDAYRALPPLPSPVDQARVAALVARNTTEMPWRDFFREWISHRMARRPSPLGNRMTDVEVSPWEWARFRRVQDVLAAARIQTMEREGGRVYHAPSLDDPSIALVIGEGRRATVLSPLDLRRLDATTPLMRLFEPPGSLSNHRFPSDDAIISDIVSRRALGLILELRLWQAQHGGRLPESLDEIESDDLAIHEAMVDPFAKSVERFGYIRSEGQSLPTLEPLRPDSLARRDQPQPTDGYMLLYSIGPDGRDNQAAFSVRFPGEGDIIFPIKDDVPPPE